MAPAALPPDEPERLASLRAYGILDTGADPRFDAVTRAAARALDMPVALVSLVDEDRQWFKSALGCFPAGGGTGRDVAFCAHAVLHPDRPLVVEDTTADPRFADNPLVTGEAGLRFYAGVPLLDGAGRALGTLCVADTRPRRLSAEALALLGDLATAACAALELHRSLAELRESEEHHRVAVALRPQHAWTADPDGRILQLDPRLGAAAAPWRRGLLGEGWARLMHPDELPRMRARWTQALRSGEPCDVEHRMRAAGGGYRWFRSFAAPRRDADGRIMLWYGTTEDITERRLVQAQVTRLAYHDALTGLPNRALFRENLERRAALAATGEPFALLSIDLDGFKAINDTLGHGAGDALLRQVAARLSGCMRDGDCLARSCSDEFLVLRPDEGRPEGALRLAEQILHALRAPAALDGQLLTLGASIGVAFAPRDGADPDRLLHSADLALRRAKAEEPGSCRFFEPRMDEALRTRQALLVDLRQAPARGELHLAYQPLVDLRARRVDGFEALLRWHHPVRGPVPPAEFIPVAEAAGLIGPIGDWALRQACRDAALWPRDVRVAVNLSPFQFRQRDLPERVRAALGEAGLPPGRLGLEITESVMLPDDEGNLSTLHALRALGVRIAMDDFGTGYSSLAYLHRFPFDELKIDRSFVSRLTEAEGAQAIVRAIMGMSRALRIATVAEGVETRRQLDWLRAEGCDKAQGYLFGRPVPVARVPALIEAIDRRLAAAADGASEWADAAGHPA